MSYSTQVKSEPRTGDIIFEHQATRYNQPVTSLLVSKKLNESVRKNYEAEEGRVIVAVIPHTMSPTDCLERKSFLIFNKSKTDFISSVTVEYARQFDSRTVVTLSRVSGSKQLGAKAKIGDVAQKNHFVVLKASKVDVSELVLWETFVTQAISFQICGPSQRTIDHHASIRQIYNEWNNMSIELRNLFGQQARHLSSHDCGNMFAQLAFWIYYQEFFRQSRHARPHDTLRRRELLFKSVLEKWRKHTKRELEQKMIEAVEKEKLFPVPRAPASITVENIFVETETISTFLPLRTGETDVANLPLESLERRHERGLEILTDVARILPSADTRFTNWLQGITLLTQRAALMPTKIGVMGQTGLGKSTIINALLDEKDLLPTSFVEACTATPIEVRFEDGMSQRYRAKVRFLSEHAWNQDILMCLQYLEDPSAAAAYDDASKEAKAKIQAAYPEFGVEDMDLDNLMRVEDIQKRLGTTIVLEAETSKDLTQQIQKYVASKEIPSNQMDWDHENRLYWPLVESIELCLKAPILQSGVVLVDLPGVRDSNRARAAVAKNYQASCSHIFFVSDIARAASDEAILNFVCERQKKEKNTTIICSKADQMDVSLENARSVRVEAPFMDLEAKQKENDKTILELERRKSGNEIQIGSDELFYSTAAYELQVLELDLNKIRAGIPVYEQDLTTPMTAFSLRIDGIKQRRLNPPSRAAHSITPTQDEQPADQRLLTENDIQESIAVKYQESEKVLTRANKLIEENEGIIKDIEDLRSTQLALTIDKYRLCHNARNSYTRSCLEERLGNELREASKGLYHQFRSADTTSLDLQNHQSSQTTVPRVFCVSAKSFLDRHDAQLSLEDTEIPQLHNHCLQLCEDEKFSQIRPKVNATEALVDTLRIWTSVGLEHGQLSLDEQRDEMEKMNQNLLASQTAFSTEVSKLKSSLGHILNGQITEAIKRGIKECQMKAAMAVANWKTLSASSWRQTIRKHGLHAGKNVQTIDFNLDLSVPLIEELSRAWDCILSNEIANDLDKTTSTFRNLFSQMHDIAYQSVAHIRPGSLALSVLQKQPQKYEPMLTNAVDEARSVITEIRWDFKNWAPKTVQDKLKKTYEGAAALVGPGSSAKRRDHFSDYVVKNSNNICKALEATANQIIKAIMVKTLNSFDEEVTRIIQLSTQDYVNAVSGQSAELSSEDRELRQKVADLIRVYDEDAVPNSGVASITTNDDDTSIKVEP